MIGLSLSPSWGIPEVSPKVPPEIINKLVDEGWEGPHFAKPPYKRLIQELSKRVCRYCSTCSKQIAVTRRK